MADIFSRKAVSRSPVRLLQFVIRIRGGNIDAILLTAAWIIRSTDLHAFRMTVEIAVILCCVVDASRLPHDVMISGCPVVTMFHLYKSSQILLNSSNH